MRAIVIREPGGPDVLELRDVPDPDPPFGHVRVRVRYAGVNRADLLQRMGVYPAPPGVPRDIPGLEYMGLVEACGPGATRFREGDRVYGLLGGGAYAEKIIAHEREVAPVPKSLDDRDAAAVPEAFVTAYDALVVRGGLLPGETVLIHAVGSGVGVAGVAVARALGCTVLGTSRTRDKIERAKALGLHEGVVPEQGRFAKAVLDALEVRGGRGVDVTLDLVGGGYVGESVACAALRGRLVLVGLTGGVHTELMLGAVLQKRLTIVGTVLRSRPLEEKIVAAELLDRRLGPWLSEGRVKPSVDRVFPLAEVAGAHAYVGSNESFGKVLLDLG